MACEYLETDRADPHALDPLLENQVANLHVLDFLEGRSGTADQFLGKDCSALLVPDLVEGVAGTADRHRGLVQPNR